MMLIMQMMTITRCPRCACGRGNGRGGGGMTTVWSGSSPRPVPRRSSRPLRQRSQYLYSGRQKCYKFSCPSTGMAPIGGLSKGGVQCKQGKPVILEESKTSSNTRSSQDIGSMIGERGVGGVRGRAGGGRGVGGGGEGRGGYQTPPRPP